MPTESSPLKTPIQGVAPYLFILLGASNLARGYNALAQCLIQNLSPHPVEILHAMGPGRGYCADGGWLQIRYPSIGSCGIINSVGERSQSPRRVLALITDIGNDIMYDVPVGDITSCLHNLFQELDAIGADVFVNPIPVDFAEDVSERQFRILKSIFYPKSGIDYQRAAESVVAVNQFLHARAGGRVHLLPDTKNFCGVDKIHYSVFRGHKAWSQVTTEMLRGLPVKQVEKISWLATIISLFANMGRLVCCDMFSWRKKPTGTF